MRSERSRASIWLMRTWNQDPRSSATLEENLDYQVEDVPGVRKRS
jgi:hypothetical protein